MNLEVALGIMGVERGEIGLGIAPAFGLRIETEGHRLAKDRQSLLEIDDVLLMHKGQGPLGRGQRVFQLGKKDQVGLQPLDDRLQGKLREEAGIGSRFRTNPAGDNLQGNGCGLLAHLDRLNQRLPVPVQH
ncbi:MAG: hypothetical protein ACD_75C01838G0001 [uncultured bacterium]|nr:MAG: hypothetical protein ACD_75C01838G0001 [uncultured bacterium]